MYRYADQLLLALALSTSGMRKQLISSLVSSHFINQNVEESDNLAKYDPWREAAVYSGEYQVMLVLITLLLIKYSCLCQDTICCSHDAPQNRSMGTRWYTFHISLTHSDKQLNKNSSSGIRPRSVSRRTIAQIPHPQSVHIPPFQCRS
jgi:hypothetical protein